MALSYDVVVAAVAGDLELEVFLECCCYVAEADEAVEAVEAAA